MAVHFPAFHKIEKNSDSFSIHLLIRKFHADNCIVQVQDTALNTFSVTKYIHKHIRFLIRGTQQESGRMTGIKLFVLLIIEQLRKCSRTYIIF